MSESLHGYSTDLLQVFRTISIPHAAAMGQSRTINNHGRSHKNLVTGLKSKKKIDSKKGAYSKGTGTNLCPELRQSLTAASSEYAQKHKKNTEKWLRWQFKTRQRNEQTKVETESENTGEGNVVALYIFDQSNSPHSRKTVKEAQEECPRVRSCRLDVVKDQLHKLYIGLGIEEAHRAYSKEVHTYTADEIFKHLAETAIPLYVDLKSKGKFPTVAPLKLPRPPNMATLGTMSELGNNIYKKHILSR